MKKISLFIGWCLYVLLAVLFLLPRISESLWKNPISDPMTAKYISIGGAFLFISSVCLAYCTRYYFPSLRTASSLETKLSIILRMVFPWCYVVIYPLLIILPQTAH